MTKPSEEIYNDGKLFQQSPIAIATLATSGSADNPTDVLFANFVGYAAANWTYNATSGSTGQDLLDGTGGKMPACYTIAEAFTLLVKELVAAEKLPVAVCSMAKLEGSEGRFLVKQGLKCFDRRVIGNVGNYGAKTDQEFGVGTYFSSHYFCQVGTKYFDPCLMASYATKEGPVWKRSTNFMPGLGRLNPPMVKVGLGSDLVLLMNDTKKQLPGFGSTWQIVLPKECKRVLDAAGFELLKKDPAVVAGRFF